VIYSASVMVPPCGYGTSSLDEAVIVCVDDATCLASTRREASRFITVVEAIDRQLRDAGAPCVLGEAVLDSTSSDHAPRVIAHHVHAIMWLEQPQERCASRSPGVRCRTPAVPRAIPSATRRGMSSCIARGAVFFGTARD